MNKRTEPFYFIDLLKIATLFSIVLLHLVESLFYTDGVYHPRNSAPGFWHIQYFGRLFALGGQVLVMTTFFLFGLNNKTKKKLAMILPIALFGQVLLTLTYLEGRSFVAALEWDIYGYLFVTTGLLLLLPQSWASSRLLMLVCLLFLWIPPRFIQSLGEGPLWAILTGKFTSYNSSAWPLVPWFFLALLSYLCGNYVRLHFEDFRSISRKERLTWVIFFLLAAPNFFHFYWTPIGQHFYQFTFTSDAHLFWSNFIGFVFVLRYSLTDFAQLQGRNRFMKWVSSLCWTRNVALIYFISFIVLYPATMNSEYFQRYGLAFDLYLLAFMPTCEFLCRGILWLKKKGLPT